MASRNVITAVAVGAGILAIVIISIIISSFSYLHYYQLGFKRHSTTGFIYTDKVYEGGRHFLGPLAGFKTYPADAQFVYLRRASFFTKSNLTVEINVRFEYFLRPEQLQWLHKDYELAYHSVIEKRSLSALKDATSEFDLDAFIKDRTRVEARLYDSVRERLGGKCCPKVCDQIISPRCRADCVPLSVCEKKDAGIFVEARYFHLGTVHIDSRVGSKYLAAIIAKENQQKEQHLQDKLMEEKRTDQLVREINNEANEVLKLAAANASLIRERAEARAKKLVAAAHINGSGAIIGSTGLSGDAGLSVHYISALQQMPNAHYAIDFNQLTLMSKP